MLYTSRFQNPELKSGNYTVVGIVRGLPRFKLGYERAGNIMDIAPTREIFKIEDRDEFAPPYKAHLDEVGFERISAQIQKYVELGKDVVLCCYEDVREPNEWCHRLIFAEWWFEKTGERIPELYNSAPIKTKTKSGSVKEDELEDSAKLVASGTCDIQEIQIELTNTNPLDRLENVEANFGTIKGKIDPATRERWLAKAIVLDGKYIIQVEYNKKWRDTHPNWHPCYYVINEDLTRTRIGLEVAYELYSTGKVEREISYTDLKIIRKRCGRRIRGRY